MKDTAAMDDPTAGAVPPDRHSAMHPTHDPRQPRPLPTGWKNWLILVAFLAAGFVFAMPAYFMVVFVSGTVLSFLAVTWGFYIGLALSLIVVVVVVAKHRKKRFGTYGLAFGLGVFAFFAYGSFFTALGYA